MKKGQALEPVLFCTGRFCFEKKKSNFPACRVFTALSEIAPVLFCLNQPETPTLNSVEKGNGNPMIVVVNCIHTMPEAMFMEKIPQLIERGLLGGIVFAAVLAGFAGFLYVLYRALMLLRPKQIRQEEQRIRSHRFYNVSGRGRSAYLILCLEQALQFYRQDLTAWEWILRKLWLITDDPRDGWIDHWLDSVGEVLPGMVLTNNSENILPEEARKAKALYEQAGTAMIVIHTIIDSAYTIVGKWSPNTDPHDPDALSMIDRVEETMEQFGVPLPPNEITQLLISEQRDPSFGKPFDGLRFSCLSMRAK